MGFSVGPAKTQDVPGMLELLARNGEHHYRLRSDVFRADALKYDMPAMEAMLAEPSRPVFTACDGGAVAGYAMCELKRISGNPVLADRTVLHIHDLFVDERRRGQGIGRALLGVCAGYARENGCSGVELNVWECNADAVRFYETGGFVTQKRGMELLL